MKVLIAEDDPISLLLLRRAVERLGHECLAMTDGVAAWDAFVAHAPEVVITDWMMPGSAGPNMCAGSVTANGTATSSCTPRSPTTITP